MTQLQHRLLKNPNYSLVLYTLPALILFLLFIAVPFISGIAYSFTSWNGLDPIVKFIGIKNYVDMFKDSYFVDSIIFTIKYAVVAVVFQNIGAILLASALDGIRKGRNLFRSIFFLPNVLSGVVVGFIWAFVFTKVFEGLYSLTGLSFFDWSWFGNPDLAYWTIVIVAQWVGMGYLMIIYIAGFESIDKSYVEASLIDGAGYFQQLIRIKLPLIMPSIVIGVFTTTMNSLREFDLVFVMTQGGPFRATETIAVNIYSTAYVLFEFGRSCAQAVVLFLFVLLITYTELLILKRKELEA